MPRFAPVAVSVLALTVVAAPTLPAHSSPSARTQQVSTSDVTRTRAATTSLDAASSGLGATFVNVSWNWIRNATGYKVQLSKTKDFTNVVAAKKPRNDAKRPPGGRQATVLGQLRDATYYWARVRKVSGKKMSAWTDPVRVATKAHLPDRISDGRGVLGTSPGTTTIKWKSDGGYTDFYRITTALTPFGGSKTPAVGRHSTTFTVPGNRQSVTLTPAQTAAAGAGIGTGRFLFFRITAVRKGEADSVSRRYPFQLHTVVAGEGSQAHGSRLRVMQYNMHVATKDVPGHPWSKRQYLIAKNIARVSPAIASIQELMPAMWTSADGGVGLDKALKQAGAGRYRLTRTTGYFKGAPQDTKILYDPNQVALVSNCPDTVPSCYISLPDAHKHVAAYAKFRDLASGREFYFVSAHLTPGNDRTTDALRGRQAQAISDGIKAINTAGLPVIFGSDANSSQTSTGVDSPHQVLLDNGWYNTQSAAKVVNGQYNSVNHYTNKERPSPYGVGSMYDTIETLNLPGADVWKQVRTGSPWPSDHNMVYADLRLP